MLYGKGIMTKYETIAFFGSQIAIAKALNLTRSAVSAWGDIPLLRQLQLEELTCGKLKADRTGAAMNTKKCMDTKP